jgi:BON domain
MSLAAVSRFSAQLHCHPVLGYKSHLVRYLPKSPAMNPLKRSASAVFLAITLATMLGCAATPTTDSTGQYIDDAAITAKVKAAILDQPTLKMFDIHVATFGGTVYLWGVVASQFTIDEAGRVASGIPGVKTVKNDMRLM